MTEAITCTICRRALDPDREQIRHQRCADRLRTHLIELPGLYALMGAVLAPGTAGGGSRVSGTRTAPMPVRLEPLSLRGPGGIITTLTLWETHIREERGLSAGTVRGIGGQDLAAIVLFLRAQLPWICDHYSQAEKLDADLRDIAHDCHAAAGLLPTMMRIGDCPNPLADEQPCGTALYADPYADQVRCRWCRRTWFRPQWMALGKKLRGIEDEEEQAPEDDLVRFKVSEGSIDLQGAEVSAEVMELLVAANKTPEWDERLSA